MTTILFRAQYVISARMVTETLRRAIVALTVSAAVYGP